MQVCELDIIFNFEKVKTGTFNGVFFGDKFLIKNLVEIV